MKQDQQEFTIMFATTRIRSFICYKDIKWYRKHQSFYIYTWITLGVIETKLWCSIYNVGGFESWHPYPLTINNFYLKEKKINPCKETKKEKAGFSTSLFFWGLFEASVYFLLLPNIPIYMQVSKQLDVSLLSLWFWFGK